MEVASTLAGMAQSLRNLGRIEKAQQCLYRALEIRQRCNPSSALVAATHEQVAAFARVDGDVIQAQSSLQAALEIRTNQLLLC
jgi:tetratricopeptide (TPR) repeat protein